MRLKVVPTLVGLSLGICAHFAIREGLEWRARGIRPADPFPEFARELREGIPQDATIRIVTRGDVRIHKFAHLLNRELHPRRIRWTGPADWIVELPPEGFDRSRASFRRSVP